MKKPLAIMIAKLKATSAITAVTSTRIYGGMIPQSEKTLPAIEVFLLPGGYTDLETPVIHAEFRLKAYAASSAEAETLYGLIHDALHGIGNYSVGTNYVYLSAEDTHGQPLTDPDTGWEYYTGIFYMKIRNG